MGEQKQELTQAEINGIQIERLTLGGVTLTSMQQREYLASPDVLGDFVNGMAIPAGYKKCGKCNKVMKFYLFNKDSGAKTNTTGNCKECQKSSAAKSYKNTKSKRNYRKYYQENKDIKQKHAKEYYEKNKDEVLAKQREYHNSKQGKKVMKRSHAKRRAALKENRGIPYTRAMVIDRDKQGKKFPICYICNEPIKEIDAKLHLDHVIPVLIGGLDCFTNIGCTHSTCNLTKKKDGTDVTAEQIQRVKKLAESYIDEHPELFEDEFEEVTDNESGLE